MERPDRRRDVFRVVVQLLSATKLLLVEKAFSSDFSWTDSIYAVSLVYLAAVCITQATLKFWIDCLLDRLILSQAP